MAVVVVPFALLEGIARKLGSIVLQITGTLNPESRLGRFHAGLIRTFNTQGTLLFHIDTMILATGTIWTLGHPNRDLPDCDDLINRNCLHIALNRPSATRED
jgi:hypothetical protein